MVKFSVFSIIIFVFYCSSASGQGKLGRIYYDNKSDVLDISKENVNYKGQFNFQIPLLTKDEFNPSLPVMLNYISGPLALSEDYTEVGHGWSLNYGPMVVRELMDYPDECLEYKSPLEKGWRKGGYLEACKKYSLSDTFALNLPRSIIVDHSFYQFDLFKLRYDLSPDIFHFVISDKYRGYFLFDVRGNVKVVAPGCRVEFYNFGESGYVFNKNNLKISSFIITTSDGARYTFGGQNNAVEITSKYPYSSDLYGDNVNYISQWYIKDIELPNGRKIHYNYLDKKAVIRNVIPVNESTYYSYYGACINLGLFDDTPRILNYNFSIIKERPLIDNIRTDYVSLQFLYNSKIGIINLDSIYVKSSRNIIVDKLSFDYSSSGKFVFLKEIKKNGIKKYYFNYNDKNLPDTTIWQTDMWGNWNGGRKHLSLEVNDFNFNNSYSSSGMMSAIWTSYGGLYEILYEPHSNLTNVICGLSCPVSGARLKSIVYKDSNIVNNISFSYFKNYKNGGKNSDTSGETLYHYFTHQFLSDDVSGCWPGCSLSYCPKSYSYTRDYFFSNPSPSSFAVSLPNICYSEIQTITDSSVINTNYYTSLMLKPLSLKARLDGFKGQENNFDNSCVYSLFNYYGLIFKKTYFSIKHKTERVELYDYNISEGYKNALNGVVGTNSTYYGYLIPTTYPLLQTKSKIDSVSNGCIIDKFSYKYNKNGEVRTEKRFLNKDLSVNIDYLYADDLIVNGAGGDNDCLAITEMIKKNMLSYPIQILKYNLRDNIKSYVFGKINRYLILNNTPLRLFEYDLVKTKKVDDVRIVNNGFSNSLFFDDVFKLSKKYKYDNYNNLCEIDDVNILNSNIYEESSYLYDNKGISLLITAKNMSYDRLKDTVIKKCGSIPFDIGYDDALKIVDCFSNYHDINIYNYKHNVGLNYVINQNKKKMKYDYDNFNRLNLVYNSKGEIEKQFDYNYRPMLNAVPSFISFGFEGGKADVTVSSNVEWKVVKCDNWLICNKIGDYLTVEALASSDTNERTGQIVLRGKSGGLTCVSVCQGGAPRYSYLKVSPTNFQALGKGATGLLGTFEIVSNGCWKISYDQMRGLIPYVQVKREYGGSVSMGCGNQRLQIYQIEGLDRITPSSVTIKLVDKELEESIYIE